MSESYERNFQRTYEHSYQQNHESHIYIAIGNISSRAYQSVISRQTTLVNNGTKLDTPYTTSYDNTKIQEGEVFGKFVKILESVKKETFQLF